MGRIDGGARRFCDMRRAHLSPMHSAQHSQTNEAIPVPGAPRLAPVPLPFASAFIPDLFTPPSTPTNDATLGLDEEVEAPESEMESREGKEGKSVEREEKPGEREEGKPEERKERPGKEEKQVTVSFLAAGILSIAARPNENCQRKKGCC
jgi:hypothetical protein